MTVAFGLKDYSRADINSSAAVTALAENKGRLYLLIQNVSDVDLYVSIGGTASATVAASATATPGAGSMKLVTGAVHEWIADFIPSGAVSVKAASSSAKSVVIWEG